MFQSETQLNEVKGADSFGTELATDQHCNLEMSIHHLLSDEATLLVGQPSGTLLL